MADAKLELAADIVSAYVSNNSVPKAELSDLIASVYGVIARLGNSGGLAAPVLVSTDKQTPAVSIKKSINDDHLVCLEDGKKFKSLKRHLTADHGLSADQYRAKWGLPPDYPMVAPAYAKVRSAMAKSMGLGQQAGNGRKGVKKSGS